MTILNATETRSKLYSLIDETTETHQPIVITGKRGNKRASFKLLHGIRLVTWELFYTKQAQKDAKRLHRQI